VVSVFGSAGLLAAHFQTKRQPSLQMAAAVKTALSASTLLRDDLFYAFYYTPVFSLVNTRQFCFSVTIS